MSLLGRSLLDIQNLDEPDVFSLFESTKRIRHLHQTNKLDFARLVQSSASKYVALVFLEPSTRTRSSFEVAAYKLGIQVLCPEFGGSSSVSKGESLVDTVKTIVAMDPDVIAVRYGVSPELENYLKTCEVPVINAGSGMTAHPTQALLDSFTILEELGSVRGQKVLIVGDINHSRVARSNIKLFEKLGAEVAICAPEEFIPADLSLQQVSLDEGLDWCSVVMALRIQLERHDNEKVISEKTTSEITNDKYHAKYGLTEQRLKKLGAGIILHPGPVNQGVEMTSAVLKDPRCRVLTQVGNGVYIRAAVLSQILGIKV